MQGCLGGVEGFEARGRMEARCATSAAAPSTAATSSDEPPTFSEHTQRLLEQLALADDDDENEGDSLGEYDAEATFHALLNANTRSCRGDDEELERRVHISLIEEGDDAKCLRLLEANPISPLCFFGITEDLLEYVANAILSGGKDGGQCNCMVSLGCGRGLFEWLLIRELHARAHDPLAIFAFELEGVTVDFLPRACLIRVKPNGDEIPDEEAPQCSPFFTDACLLCAWGESGMLPIYLKRHRGPLLVTIGEEGFTDPAPGERIRGWKLEHMAEFGSGGAVTVYRRNHEEEVTEEEVAVEKEEEEEEREGGEKEKAEDYSSDEVEVLDAGSSGSGVAEWAKQPKIPRGRSG